MTCDDHSAPHQGTILIADDTANNLRLLSNGLIEKGYQVHCAINGHLALIGCRNLAPDLVLLDVMMPDLDGYEVCRRLKADEATRDIPVIFLSALNDVVDKVRAFELGGVDYITKPFHIREVQARIENQLTIVRLRKHLQEQNDRLQQEIQNRQQAQQNLRDSELKFRCIVENANDIIYMLTPSGHFSYVSPNWTKILGHEVDQVVGQPFSKFIHPEDLPACQRAFYTLVDTDEGVTDLEYRALHCNGGVRWQVSNVSIVRDPSGQPLYCIGIAHDISDRKRTEEALRQQQQYLKLVLDNIPQQVFWKDTNLIFKGCNRNWAEAAGLDDPDAVVGKTDYDLVEDYRIAETFRHADRRVMETNQAQLHQIAKKYRSGDDGNPIWLDISRIPFHDDRGRVIGILGVLDDITDRKMADEALRAEQAKSEQLLLNILPQPIAERLKQEQSAIADGFENVTVLFADIVGFTQLSSRTTPKRLVGLLNQIFSLLDSLCDRHGLEKIKTIGDSYMAVGGLPTPRDDHAEAIANFALDIQSHLHQFEIDPDLAAHLVRAEVGGVPVRIGINTGSVVAGVIGTKKFSYDLWGDTVNIASRMESQGQVGKIQVTAATYDRLKQRYHLEERGLIQVKGRGEMLTYWLLGLKPEFSPFEQAKSG